MRNIFLAAALSLAALPAGAQIGSPSDGSSYVGPFGPAASGGVPQYAQTFQRPAAGDDWLQGFTFDLGDWNADASGSGLLFQAAVYTVNGSQLGSQLFLSGVQAGSSNYFGFDAYDFATPNLFLDPGVSMFALVLRSVSNQNDALNVIASGATDYAAGALFTVGDDGALTAVDGPSDAAFSATFSAAPISAVPEPATLVLVASGLGVLGLVSRRKRA